MTDNEIADLKYEIQEKEKALGYFKVLQNELEDSVQIIKDSCGDISDKLCESLKQKVVNNLKASLPSDLVNFKY